MRSQKYFWHQAARGGSLKSHRGALPYLTAGQQEALPSPGG